MANRWKEHYEKLLNRDTTPKIETLDQLPQQPIIENMGEPPCQEKAQDSVRPMKSNKATGPDGIPTELLKEGGPDLLSHIHTLLLKIWEEEKSLHNLGMPWLSSSIRKEIKQTVEIIMVLPSYPPLGKPESQSEFRPNSGTMDMIVIARQLQEKCQE